MTKTYIVTGISNYGKSKVKKTLYAGVSESKAKQINIELPYTMLTLEVWIDDMMVEKFIKTDIYNWCLEYSKLSILEDDMYDLETKFNKIKSEHKELLSLMESEKQ